MKADRIIGIGGHDLRSSYLTIGLLAAGLLLTATATEAATAVNCGDVLNVPGKYYLAGDLACTSAPAVQITASNVDFDLRGHRITEVAGNSAGIWVGAADCAATSPTAPSTGLIGVSAPVTRPISGSRTWRS